MKYLPNFPIIVVVLLSAFMIYGAKAEERLGPESITDYYLEPAISGYIHSTANSDDDNLIGIAAIGSLWYVKNEIDIGIEALASTSTNGLFVSIRYPVDEWNLGAGVGQIGYAVETSFGDYYAKPMAVMLFSDYQTQYGKIVGRIIFSESDKTYQTTEETCTKIYHSWPRPKCTTNTSNHKTDNIRHIIMIGLQKDL